MLEEKPKVSIITVTYNSSATVAHTLQSVVDQNYDNIEHIVVDGLSTDNTAQIVKGFSHVSKFISEKDSGMYDALNKGVKMCTGKYVGILNSDDFLTTENSINTIVEGLVRPGIDAVFGDIKFISSKDETKTIRYCNSKGWTPNKFQWGFMPNHPTYYTLKENYDRYGYFELDYNICADYELLIKHLYDAKVPYHYIPECLVTMRPNGISNGSIGKRLMLNQEIVRACRAHGMKTSLLKLSTKVFAKTAEYINPKA